MDVQATIAKYRERIESLAVHLYIPSQQADLLLFRWYLTLHETGDLERTILPTGHSLFEFLKIFQKPTYLLYTMDAASEIDNAIWLTCGSHIENVANVGMWAASNCRGKRKQAQFGCLCYEIAFELWPAVLSITWQPNVLAQMNKIGYDTISVIPAWYRKDYIYLARMTKERFMESKLYQLCRR